MCDFINQIFMNEQDDKSSKNRAEKPFSEWKALDKAE